MVHMKEDIAPICDAKNVKKKMESKYRIRMKYLENL